MANDRKALEHNPALQIARNNLALAEKQRDGPSPNKQVSVAELIHQSLVMNQAGRYEESIVAAKSALRLEPGSAEAWNNIAAAYEAMHQWDEAIDAAQKALALKPDLQIAKNNLAWSLAQKQKTSH